ncbi:hypothetical protein [Salinibius halmophilus]|uniref:hypothetical protein n=1 Tax=Salinibius halmophilus TaxID=1853216 RepID=UPI001314A3E6|nr:hypothetical protein [Salinibius halmophilus]
MDVVNFVAGSKTVALPILDILLTEQLADDYVTVPGDDPDLIGVKEYLGVSTPIFDLVKMLEGKSTDVLISELLAKLSNQQVLSQSEARLARRLAGVTAKDDMEKLGERLQEAKEQLKPVLVYTTRDGNKPLIGFVVDLVADTHTVDDSHIQPLADALALLPRIAPRTKSLFAGLIGQSKSDPAILLNPQAFSKWVADLEIETQ